MQINSKSVEILLRSTIERNLDEFEKEMKYLINESEKSNKKKQLQDLNSIHNKLLYYFDIVLNKWPINNVAQGFAKDKKIEDNDLYKVFYPNDIEKVDLIYPKETYDIINWIIKSWSNKEAILKKWIPLPNKILLYWDPWTWKTQIAMNMAKDMNIPIILVRLDELISSFLWKTGKNIKEVFALASQHKCILFFDELDTVGKKRDDQQELWELKRVVTVFLQNLDLMHVEWIIFWSTNHAELIDMALRRRFDVYINVNNPSKNEIENIFNLFLLPEISQEIRTSWINMKEFLPSLTWSYIKKISDHINRRCLIEESYDIELILSSLFEAIGIWGQWNSINKKIRKDLVLKLYNEEWWIKKISDITQIPYTTIRDWVLSLWNKKWLTI